MVWRDMSMEGCTDLYRLCNGTLTPISYWGEILGPVLRPYADAEDPGVLLVHHSTQPQYAGRSILA